MDADGGNSFLRDHRVLSVKSSSCRALQEVNLSTRFEQLQFAVSAH
jgi:hypothetical protein